MNRELLMLVDAISREKNVERDVVFGAVELALASATTSRSTMRRNRKAAASSPSSGGTSSAGGSGVGKSGASTQ